MTKKIRISLDEDLGPMKWPQRCPRCGRKDNLVYTDMRTLQESFYYKYSSWGYSGLAINERTIVIPILTCKEHAFPNELGGKMLESGSVMMLFRGSIYVSLGLLAVALFQIHEGALTFHKAFLGSWGFSLILLYGLPGSFILHWARRSSCVRPLTLDPDFDVTTLRFSDDAYAEEFRHANLKAVGRALAEDKPFFLRPNFWKPVLVIGLILFLVHIFGKYQ